MASNDDTRFIPPASLILDNGIGYADRDNIQAEFHAVGHGLIREMMIAGLLQASYNVLDVGCGLGRLARPLVEYLDPASSYYGIDINESSIDWCRENYRSVPNFRFIYADLFSNEYNRSSKFQAESYRFPLSDGYFDFIWSTSLFTHMMLNAVDNYIGEMARVLKPGRRMWNNFMLLDEISVQLVQRANSDQLIPVSMQFPVEGGLVTHENNPEALIGLYVDRIEAVHAKHGLEIVEIRKGPWSGRSDDLRASYQDVIIARKPLS